MSNHFTGLNVGFPAEDARLDLTDLYAFQAPADPARTVLILNSNTFAQGAAFHPDAVYRINIDNDGDAETDIAFSMVFTEPDESGRQRVTVYKATGAEARQAEPVGTPIIADAEVSFGPEPNIVTSGAYTFFAGIRSDAFILDVDGFLKLFDTSEGKGFTDLEVVPDAWTGNDRFTEENVFSMALELPTSELAPSPAIGVWGRCSLRRNGKLEHVDRAGHPSVASFFNTDETKEEYNRTEPAQDRELFLHQAIEILQANGGYSEEEAERVIDEEGLLPDMLRFDPAKPARYPNGRSLTDHVIATRLAMVSNNRIPGDGLSPHDDLLEEFPYLGTPHPARAAASAGGS